jgi:hypothetical protein
VKFVAYIFLEAKAKCTKVHSFKLYLRPINKFKIQFYKKNNVLQTLNNTFSFIKKMNWFSAHGIKNQRF